MKITMSIILIRMVMKLNERIKIFMSIRKKKDTSKEI